MKIYLSIITLLFGLSLSAQTFDRVFSYPGDENGALQLIEYNSNYYINFYYEEDSQYKSVLYQLENDGKVVDSIMLHEHYMRPLLLNSHIFIFKLENDSDSVSILKINPNGLNIEKKYEVKLKNKWRFLTSVDYINYCSCFTLSGIAVDTIGYRKTVVLQLDTHLNITNEVYITPLDGPYIDSLLSPTSESSSVLGVMYQVLENPTSDGLWTLGYPMDTVPNMQGGTPGITPMDSNLIRDSINHKLLRSDIPAGVGFPDYARWSLLYHSFTGVRLTDTSYLFAGRSLTSRYDTEIGEVVEEFNMGYVITDNQLNDIRWEFWGGVDSTEMSASGKGVGRHPDYKHAYIAYTSNFGFFAGMAYPYTLMKLDLEGNELWIRHYTVPWSYSVKSVLATSDGGALMVGTMVDTAAIEKDIWVVKVDSLGNLNSTGVNEVEGKIDASNYLLYPNPAKNQLNLLKVNQFKPYKFELYDAYGRLVKTVSWREDHQLVDVSSLASGMYVYRIIDQEGNVGSGKLMVE